MKVYIESKIWPMSLVGFIGIFLLITYFFSDSEIVTRLSFPYIVVTFAVLLTLVYFYPTAKLELSEQGFSFTKGKKHFLSEWGDVEGIYLANAGRNANTQNFFIRTKQGTTSIIDHFSLRMVGGGFFCNFLKDFEKMSGKPILIGDPIIKN